MCPHAKSTTQCTPNLSHRYASEGKRPKVNGSCNANNRFWREATISRGGVPPPPPTGATGEHQHSQLNVQLNGPCELLLSCRVIAPENYCLECRRAVVVVNYSKNEAKPFEVNCAGVPAEWVAISM